MVAVLALALAATIAGMVGVVAAEWTRRPAGRKWVVYLLRDGDGTPLYTGLTDDFDRRLEEHLSEPDEWRESVCASLSGPVRWCRTRRQAARVESRRIRVWHLAYAHRLVSHPGHNRVLNRPPRTWRERVWLNVWLGCYRADGLLAPAAYPWRRHAGPSSPSVSPPRPHTWTPPPSGDGCVLDGPPEWGEVAALERLWETPAYQAPAPIGCKGCGVDGIDLVSGWCPACTRARAAERQRRSRAKRKGGE